MLQKHRRSNHRASKAVYVKITNVQSLKKWIGYCEESPNYIWHQCYEYNNHAVEAAWEKFIDNTGTPWSDKRLLFKASRVAKMQSQRQ